MDDETMDLDHGWQRTCRDCGVRVIPDGTVSEEARLAYWAEHLEDPQHQKHEERLKEEDKKYTKRMEAYQERVRAAFAQFVETAFQEGAPDIDPVQSAIVNAVADTVRTMP